MTEITEMTLDVDKYLKAARDSVWVIDSVSDEIVNEGKSADSSRKGLLERNIAHLKIVVSREEVLESGKEIDDLHDAIQFGENLLDEVEWVVADGEEEG